MLIEFIKRVLHIKSPSNLPRYNFLEDDGSFLVNDYQPCCVCGKSTNRVDYCYEARICSKEYEEELSKELKKIVKEQ